LMYINRAERSIEHHKFSEIVDLLQPGDLIVANDTRVIPARLFAHRRTGGSVEMLLLKPLANRPGVWEAMATPLRKLKPDEILFVDAGDREYPVTIEAIVSGPDGHKRALVNLGSGDEVYSL